MSSLLTAALAHMERAAAQDRMVRALNVRHLDQPSCGWDSHDASPSLSPHHSPAPQLSPPSSTSSASGTPPRSVSLNSSSWAWAIEELAVAREDSCRKPTAAGIVMPRAQRPRPSALSILDDESLSPLGDGSSDWKLQDPRLSTVTRGPQFDL
eukprot:tig00020961_g16695.t1